MNTTLSTISPASSVMNFDRVRRIFDDSVQEQANKIGKVNIIISGRTGAGKSTLVNAIFGESFARTARGRPVTQTATWYEREGHPLRLLDTKGIEAADYAGTWSTLKTEIVKGRASPDPRQHIHIGWVCVPEPMERFEDAESRLVEALKDEGIPTIIALTKHGMFPDFRADVLQLAPAADAVIPIRALEMPNLAGTFGLTDLVEATFRLLPDAVKSSFVAAKKVDGAMKAADSRKVISGAVTAAVTTALIPLPFSDAITIVPIQIGMVTGTYTPLESRQAILHGLSATDCAIIEYDYCPELSFRANSLASHFKLNQTAEQTFHIRILGKIYLPGARLWFMTAPQAYFGRSLDLKRTADMHRPNIIQDAAEFFLREHSVRSRLPDDVVRMRGRAQRLFAAPVEQPLKGCLTQLPRGLSFWVALPHVVTDRALYHAAVAQSVAFASGSIFEANAQNEPHGVGIGFGTLPAEALGKAARRLTAALEPRTAPNIICSGGFRPIAVIQPYWCGRHAARNLGALPAHLPRYEVMIDVVHDACPCRGGAMHSIGEVLTEQLDMVPMQLRVRVTRRPCGACP